MRPAFNHEISTFVSGLSNGESHGATGYPCQSPAWSPTNFAICKEKLFGKGETPSGAGAVPIK